VRESLALGADSSISFVSHLERGLTVDADPDQLFRMLLNLARNAAQALEARTADETTICQIRISGKREGIVTIIEVSDSGPGVPENVREHLFEAFQSSSRRGGTGLGLAIAAELVRAHGGQIRLVDSNIGATFRIEIPDRPVELHAPRDERATA
jgi:signal transduction histidine kinase